MKGRLARGAISVITVHLVLLLYTALACADDPYQPLNRIWESRGIGGGGALYVPVVSPHDQQTIFMATDMSSVFRSGDFGRHWQTLPFSSLQGGVDADIRFTSDPQVLYAIDLSDEQRTPVRSSDGGAGWMPLAADPTGGDTYFLDTDPQSTERLLVSDYDTLYFSDNSGASFTSVHTSSGGLYIAGVFWDGQTIIVGTQAGLLGSIDGGITFNQTTVGGLPAGSALVSLAGAREGASVRLFAVAAGDGDVYPGCRGYGVGDLMYSYQGVFRLDWGQPNWTAAATGIGANARPVFIAMASGDIDTVYVAGGDISTSWPIVYKTENGGIGWSSVFVTDNNDNIATGWSGRFGDSDWWFGEYALGFAVCAANSDRLVITDLGFVHVSDDGGVSWRQAYVNSADQNNSGAPTPKGLSYRGIGLQQTSAWWLTWADSDDIMASFTDIRGMHSGDGGLSWRAGSSLGLPHNTTYHTVRHPDGNLYAATGTVHDLYQSTYLADSRIDNGGGRVLQSEDDGLSWTLLHDFGHPVVWLALDPGDPNRLCASVVHSSAGDIYCTSNLEAGSAADWSRQGTPSRTEGHPYNLAILHDGTMVATYSGRRNSSGAFTTSSGVFVSSNGGDSWQDVSDSNMMRWTKDITIDPHDPDQNTWYVSVFSHWGSYPNEVGGLYRTTNRGQNWSRISDLYRVESCTVDPGQANRLYLATEAQGLWYTDNLGDSAPVFTPLPNYPFKHPVRIFFNPYDSEEVWTVSFGGGMRVSRPLSLTDVIAALQVSAGGAVVASDRNDDGRTSLADAVFVLRALAE